MPGKPKDGPSMSASAAASDALLGERELDVMAVLWDLESGTVTEVRERLHVPLAYTTILTILRNLEAKKFVRHEEEGRAHRYFPRVQQHTAQRNALSRLLSQLFDGSPHALLAQLVDDNHLKPSDLQQLAREINAASELRQDHRAHSHVDDREVDESIGGSSSGDPS